MNKEEMIDNVIDSAKLDESDVDIIPLIRFSISMGIEKGQFSANTKLDVTEMFETIIDALPTERKDKFKKAIERLVKKTTEDFQDKMLSILNESVL